MPRSCVNLAQGETSRNQRNPHLMEGHLCRLALERACVPCCVVDEAAVADGDAACTLHCFGVHGCAIWCCKGADGDVVGSKHEALSGHPALDVRPLLREPVPSRLGRHLCTIKHDVCKAQGTIGLERGAGLVVCAVKPGCDPGRVGSCRQADVAAPAALPDDDGAHLHGIRGASCQPVGTVIDVKATAAQVCACRDCQLIRVALHAIDDDAVCSSCCCEDAQEEQQQEWRRRHACGSQEG